MYYCGNGLIIEDKAYCESAITCIDGYLWDSSKQECRKCDNNIFDINFDLIASSFCELYSKGDQLNFSCGYSSYLSIEMKNAKCMSYCDNGLVAEQNQNCSLSTLCVKGFLFNDSTKKCEKCQKMIIDFKYNIYQCESCALTSNLQYCQCGKTQYFSYRFAQCTYYCDKGIIALNMDCSSSQECVDGFKYNLQTQICEKIICSESNFDSNLNLYKCKNCSLVTNLEHCKLNENVCSDLQYFSFQSLTCKRYCLNGITSKESCSAKHQFQFDCIDGLKMNRAMNNCTQTCLPDNFAQTYLLTCEFCDFASRQSADCGKCIKNLFYSSNLNQCMAYCGNGIIAKVASTCSQSNTCVDNFVWNSSKQICEQLICSEGIFDSDLKLIQCENCSITSNIGTCYNPCGKSTYFSNKQRKCMVLCGTSGVISEDSANCAVSNTCVDGFQWNYLTEKCEQQHTCNLEVLDPNLSIFQCPNCSLVTNTLLCNNHCQASQFNSLNESCMTYCGNGIIAKDMSHCAESNICIDDRIECNKFSQTKSESQSETKSASQQNLNNDQSQLIIYVLIASLAILLIFVIPIFVCCTIKRFKSAFKIQQFQLDNTQKQFDQMKGKIEEEKQAFHQKQEAKEQIGIQSKEIMPNFNQKSKSKDLEDQPIEEQTMFKYKQNDYNQDYQTSQQQFQSNPILENQESQ